MKELGKAFKFVFQDPNWVSKCIIAALFMLLCLIGLGIPVLVGYYIQLTQRVMRREQYPLPEWSDIGVKFIIGFKFIVALFVYVLPIILLYIPFIVVIAVASMHGEDSSELGSLIAVIYMFGFVLIILPYGLLLTLCMPIISYRFALRESIGDALDVGAVLHDFRLNWANTTVVALLVVGLESFSGLGIFLLFIGIFFTLFYTYAVSAYLNGALYLERTPEPGAAQGNVVQSGAVV